MQQRYHSNASTNIRLRSEIHNSTQLVVVLDSKVSDSVKKSRNWVDSPDKVSKQLKRFQSLFRKAGIVISKGKLDGQRIIVIERI